MEVTTVSNLIAFAMVLSGLTFDVEDSTMTEEEFSTLIDELYNQLNGFANWNREGTFSP